MSKKPKRDLKIKENKLIKDSRMDNRNHKVLGDNTNHPSVNKHTGSITLISSRQTLQHPSVLIVYNISQHTGVYNPFQTTLFTKTTALKRLAKKVTGNEAINACVSRRVPRLTTNGLGLSTKPAFYWALYLRDVQTLPQGRFWNIGSLETQRLFCCAVHVIYNQTCYCWVLWCNHINLHFFNLVHFGCCAGAVRHSAGCQVWPSELQFFSTEEKSWFICKKLISGWFMLNLRWMCFLFHLEHTKLQLYDRCYKV